MIPLLIPLARFKVCFEVGGGKPYSVVDELVLHSVGASSSNEATSLDQIWQTFRLPRRLLVEILVNLFQEGWISLEPGGFLRTLDGDKAAAAGTSTTVL